MKKLNRTASFATRLRTPALLLASVLVATAIYLGASARGFGDPAPTGASTPPPCVVCHKGVQTLYFPCNSLQYRGHRGHGDPMMACPPSNVATDPGYGSKGQAPGGTAAPGNGKGQ